MLNETDKYNHVDIRLRQFKEHENVLKYIEDIKEQREESYNQGLKQGIEEGIQRGMNKANSHKDKIIKFEKERVIIEIIISLSIHLGMSKIDLMDLLEMSNDEKEKYIELFQ